MYHGLNFFFYFFLIEGTDSRWKVRMVVGSLRKITWAIREHRRAIDYEWEAVGGLLERV